MNCNKKKNQNQNQIKVITWFLSTLKPLSEWTFKSRKLTGLLHACDATEASLIFRQEISDGGHP